MKGRKLSSDDIVNLQKLLRTRGKITPRTRHTRLDRRGSSRNGSSKFFRPLHTFIAPQIYSKESISLHHHQTPYCSPCNIPRDQHMGDYIENASSHFHFRRIRPSFESLRKVLANDRPHPLFNVDRVQ